ncbi:MAG: nicotinate-nucleotide adenylyltransferase [Coriobacteriia bacterium]|nr:nicotinate-nucleotide adenylyltransferase [Coriobacteriia bacterium]
MTASPYGDFAQLGFDGAPARLGILGGTFDPIHLGHLACAEAARCDLGLDGVLLMPAAVPVYKLDQQVTSAQQRLDMCRLAAQGNPFLQVSDLEIGRGGRTYTADTLRQVREHFPSNVELVFIAGLDAAATMPKWRESQVIADLARIAVVTRPGSDLADLGDPHTLDGRFRVSVVRAPELAIASSDLRQRVAAGKSIRYLVPEPVREYVLAQGLYERNDR